jgi:nucleotide-binding universal stress UspA family protein
MKVLFATDGSPCAQGALRTLADRLAWFREPVELTLLNVHPPIPYLGATTSILGSEPVERYYREEGHAALAPSAAELTRRGIAHRLEKRVGDPAATIVAVAKAGGYDVIALGAQGHSALGGLLLGSVAIKVLAHASVPVLALR